MTRPYADIPLADLVEGYRKMREALERIRDHDGSSYRFGDEIRAIAREALEALK